MQTWPYFRARESRRAILANAPTPVTSCWNGMGTFEYTQRAGQSMLPFRSAPLSLANLVCSIAVVMPAEPFVSNPTLRFRGIPDSLAASHLEGSECCLVHVDNPLRAKRRTCVNPLVRVGYSVEAYDAVHPQALLRSSWQICKALWENRIRRWITSPWLNEWEVQKRAEKWRKLSKLNKEAGDVCMVDEMQVLVENGWQHV
jgi:hypothetical protein